MLTDIRKLSNHFLFKFFSFLIVVSFVSWGISDILRDRSDPPLVTFKNERPILTTEFLQSKQERIRYIQTIVQAPLTDQQLADLNIDNIVLDSLINDRMLNHISNYYDLSFSDENMIGEVKKTPAFFDNDGKFSYEIFRNFVHRNGLSESNYLSSMKKDLSSRIILDSFNHSKIFPQALTMEIAKHLNTEITFDIITASSTGTNIKISEQEVEDFYKKHQSEFITQELRDAEYIEISPNAIKVQVSEQEIKEYYDENIGDYRSPALFSFYDIIVDSEEKSQKIITILSSATDRAEIKNITGKQISEFFRENVQETKLAPQFIKLLKSNQSISTIELDGKHHILKKEIYIPSKFVELKDAKKDIELLLRQKKFDSEFAAFIRSIDDFIASAEDLKQVSEKFSLELKHSHQITKSDGDKISEKAFELAEGDFSEVFELPSGDSAILFLKKIIPSRTLAFDEVKTDIHKKLQQQAAYKEDYKKLSEIKDKNEKANFSQLSDKSGFTLDQNKKMTIAKMNAGMIESYPERILRELFSIKSGTTSVIEFNGKIYLAKLKEKSYGKYVEYEKINSTIQKNYQSAILDEIFFFLRKDSGTKILK
jgi:peptidyl-prolyl cis-trans isomerase D